MKTILHFLLSIAIVVTLSACQGVSQAPTVETEFEIINLQISSNLTHWLPDVAACADPLPKFGIITEVRPDEALDINEGDLILRLGQRLETDPYVAVMGVESVAIVAGGEVPFDSIGVESLRAIFTGKIQNAHGLPEMADAGNLIDQPILTLSYPEGHQLRRLFVESYMDGQAINGDPLIFSSLDTLTRLLQDNPSAIGYCLESQIPHGVKKLNIIDMDVISARYPVLAITKGEPGGNLRQLLLCLQGVR